VWTCHSRLAPSRIRLPSRNRFPRGDDQCTLGGTLNNADINDMPLNGRNYQNLLALRPGVTVQPGGGPWTQSSNNVRPDESGWMLDGVINANFYDARPIANMPSPLPMGPRSCLSTPSRNSTSRRIPRLSLAGSPERL